MLGAIAGDIIGSVYENFRTKRKDFRLFLPVSFYTDDTVLSVAVADALLNGADFGRTIKRYAWRRPLRGYGPRFYRWMVSLRAKPYNSLGNGAAMRVSAVAYAARDEQEALSLARRSAECTHNHPEGIKGAQAVTLAIHMARMGKSQQAIRTAIVEDFGYALGRSVDQIRPSYKINLTCPRSVPEAITAFLDSTGFEDAVRNAVSLGGDADTQAAIAGAIAEAFYGGVPSGIAMRVWRKLPGSYRSVIWRFHQKHPTPTNVEQIAGLAGRPPVCQH